LSGYNEIKDEIDLLAENCQTEQIYTYECDFQNYSIAFRNKKDNKFHLAVASYDTETMNNKVEILDLNLKKPNDGLSKINEFKHSFPPTKMMWIPDYEGNRKDILATTAEFLRIWEIQPETNSYKEHRI
jgi:DDB1- and CUL4-associated factor 7